ncbi:hypothetical protein BOSE62_30228 [Bosea sp. 62]|nr:hypothetical protein BOSE46_140005 [Bosea sp. 46]CAD5267995.1 hypothetical protein BOSE21B_111399 [Bosea sp. 21B]CAD5270732.1 hypothetical protein BOSE7B_20241 [Bosea sp. 7B]VVT62345.1 hypothetical protein BOS5A_80005 [Bosea sp. EC-HK365B]VXB89042.1 hypothetical protein BOSE29B_140006 [Bosea sp. 29B]VXC14729.1 hypothetical protein BOSE62_30228 [Bosea sp. 62]VXC27635.1 hypothetical protein BOSE125_190006 [Bosea sp. 125]VXC66751.1 hypothetical protein BOSE127_30257 [Bosea sp. 127]
MKDARLRNASVYISFCQKAYQGRDFGSDQLFMGILMLDIFLSDFFARKSNNVIAPTKISDSMNVPWRTAKIL